MSDIEREAFEHIRRIAWDAVGTDIETEDKALVKIHEFAKEQAARQAPASGEVEPAITNEMKVECMGEFSFMLDVPCGECLAEGEDEDCEVCGGELTHQQAVTVPWYLCKKIYKRMARLASAHPPAKVPEGFEVLRRPEGITVTRLSDGGSAFYEKESPLVTQVMAYHVLDALLTTPTPATTPETECDDDEEVRECYYCGEESCDCDML